MNRLSLPLGAALLLVSAVAVAQPWNRPLNGAADAVEDAFDRAQRSNGRCRNQVAPTLDGMVDRIDAIRRQQFPMTELNQLRFELATVAQQAPFAACPIGVTEDLQRALDGLEEARIAMWNGGGRDRFGGGGGGGRRDRRNNNPNQPPVAFPFVTIAPLRLNPNVPFQNERAVQVTVPEVRFDFLQGQGFYLATKFRSFEGDWSEWVTTQLWTVPSNPFQWRNAYNHVLRYSTLAEEDFSNGRFIVHVAVFNGQGQELAFREASFRVNLPNFVQPPGVVQPPMGQRDCGTGPQDPGCMMVRDGAWAMDGATYGGFVTSLRANRSEVMRLQMAQSMLSQQYLTAAQFAVMMDFFSSEVMRLDFSQRAAPRIVNPQHAIGLSSKFRSGVFQTQYTQVMAAQPAGVPWQPGLMGPMGVMIQPPGMGQPGMVMQPGVFVQPGMQQPGVVVQVPGMTVQVQDPNVPPAVVQPQPVFVQPMGMVRDCGTGPNDPGCGLMRNGVVAMDAQVFSGFMRSLRAVMNEITREDMCEKMLARNGLTAMQLGQVLDLFNNEITRLDVAKTAASHVVNPQHALELSTKFNNSFSAEEFVEIYSGQH